MAEQTLKEKTAKGLFWGGLNNGLQQVLNLVFGVFLANILTPDDYGMVGMLAIFSLLASVIQESGFTTAIANKKDATHEDFNAIFWGSFFISLTLYAILFFCAPLIAAFFREPELIPLGRYIFIGFVLSSLGTAHNAFMFRNLLTKQKALANLIALSLSGVTAITLALNGFAYWGIATQTLVYVGTNTLCYWCMAGWHPTLHINLKPLRGLFGFGSKMLVTNMFFHINNNLFAVILGRFYSDREVGFYNQANKWNYMAHVMITGMVSGIAQPVLTQVSDTEERQRNVFRKMLRFTAFVSFPALFGLSLIAPEFITITITAKWLPSAQLLQVLCIGGAFIPIASLYSNLIIAKGKSDIYMWGTIALGVLQLAVILALKGFGIMPMVVAYVALNILWLLVWHFFVWREIRLSLWSAILDIMPFAATAAAAMLAAHFAAARLENDYASIAVKMLVAASLYLVTMRLSGSVIYKECKDFFMRKFNRRA